MAMDADLSINLDDKDALRGLCARDSINRFSFDVIFSVDKLVDNG